MADLYYLVSVKHTQERDPYITFWRPENAGYCYPLSWAGKYDYQTIMANWYYYISDNTFPVPCHVVDAIAIQPKAGVVDGDAGTVVQNNKENMTRLREAVLKGVNVAAA